jgi:hypothetical protein
MQKESVWQHNLSQAQVHLEVVVFADTDDEEGLFDTLANVDIFIPVRFYRARRRRWLKMRGLDGSDIQVVRRSQ